MLQALEAPLTSCLILSKFSFSVRAGAFCDVSFSFLQVHQGDKFNWTLFLLALVCLRVGLSRVFPVRLKKFLALINSHLYDSKSML
mmetsp:Transcript_22292/g.31499  ORF Transcript_22292/g.31499 Transcript_22292/m.31499 type:complete len:86 (+) Transcript_22292:117-374(+)